ESDCRLHSKSTIDRPMRNLAWTLLGHLFVSTRHAQHLMCVCEKLARKPPATVFCVVEAKAPTEHHDVFLCATNTSAFARVCCRGTLLAARDCHTLARGRASMSRHDGDRHRQESVRPPLY